MNFLNESAPHELTIPPRCAGHRAWTFVLLLATTAAMGCRHQAISQGAAATGADASELPTTVAQNATASGGAAPAEWAHWPMPNPASSGLPHAHSYDVSGLDTVTDRVTGLIWQRQIGPSDLRWKDASHYCASLAVGGVRTWRLPTLIEMTSLVDFGRTIPAIDQAAFPDRLQGNFWTSTPVAANPVEAWYVAFSTGFNYQGHQDYLRLGARCVHSGTSAPTTNDSHYADVTAATVRDRKTGLTWQRAVSDTITYSWADAVKYCQTLPLAGGGWRLPSMKELQTLVDVGRHAPAIDPTAFPGSPMEQFWTSSALAGSSTDAWYVSFRMGAVNTIAQSSLGFARCVR